MNEKKKLQPKVRFREFTGENAPDWEQRKLGEVFSETISYVDPKLEDLELWSVTTENGLVPKESRYNRQFLVKKTDKFKKIFPNEIVYNPMNMTLGSIGFNNLNKVVAVSGYYVTMKLKLGFNSMYFAAWLPSNKAIRLYKIFATGSLTERQRIQFSTLKDIKTCIPLESEQRIIGQFFEKLEELITLHQRKLEQLEQLKNTLLSKMFPKSGTNIPEIRFFGFTDAWKQRKLEEIIVKEIKGKAKSENISTNFANKGSLYLDTEYLNGGKPKYVSLPSDTDENDIIILWDGSQAGKLYKGVVGALGSTLKAYKIPEHTLFYYYQMLGSQEKIYNQYRTPNIPHVVKSFTSEFMIWDTSNDEKTLIIDIYSNLFNYIAIHQRKPLADLFNNFS